MSVIKKINNGLTIAGQIRLEQLLELAQAGYRSVLNLRSPEEPGFVRDEAQTAEDLGLDYAQIATQGGIFNEAVLPVLQKIIERPKPLLLHCDNGTRSAAIGFIHIAMKQGATLEQAILQAQKITLV